MNHNRVIYKVMPEHRIVIAEIKGTRWDAVEEFNEKFFAHSTSSLYLSANKFDERFHMPSSFKVVARCHPDDVFDEEKGKRIALDKLSEKYTKSLNKHLDNLLNIVDSSLDYLARYLSKYEDK